MKTFTEELIEMNACEDAVKFSEGKTLEQCWNACERGDWMLWLFKKLHPNEVQLLTLTKGHCANTVRHLMKDERSIMAVDAAIAYGEGKINRGELVADAFAFAFAFAFAYADAAYAYAAAAAADAAAAKKENQKQTADICRKYLTNIILKP